MQVCFSTFLCGEEAQTTGREPHCQHWCPSQAVVIGLESDDSGTEAPLWGHGYERQGTACEHVNHYMSLLIAYDPWLHAWKGEMGSRRLIEGGNNLGWKCIRTIMILCRSHSRQLVLWWVLGDTTAMEYLIPQGRVTVDNYTQVPITKTPSILLWQVWPARVPSNFRPCTCVCVFICPFTKGWLTSDFFSKFSPKLCLHQNHIVLICFASAIYLCWGCTV